MDYQKRILLTGGAGFIGSHLLRRFVNNYPHYQIINFDALTYAGNLESLRDVEAKSNYVFVKGNICNENDLAATFKKFQPTDVIHLAAESHVDRSISGPLIFAETNVMGTLRLLEQAKHFWKEDYTAHVFHHVSTDEVYGSLGNDGFFLETTAYDPRSPYSASKASSDHFVNAYFHTFGLQVKTSNCSNNYGSHQFPEKLIPLMIQNIKAEKPLPIYGKGENIRDWLWVEDHVRALDLIFHEGKIGETYNIGGLNEWRNIDLVRLLCQIMDKKLNRNVGQSEQLIHFVKDRAGHDARYAIDATKLNADLNWQPSVDFEVGLEKTVDWYLDNADWVNNILQGDYLKYYEEQYVKR
jgi:dTDP-glucose 4,6-dehydratase